MTDPEQTVERTAPTGSGSSSHKNPFGIPQLATEPPTRLGRFEVRSLLGEGAFGRVYLAFDAELERQVAIKVPHAGRTHRGVSASGSSARPAPPPTIHHPNVCPVYEVGTEGDLPYIVMHYVAGTTLGRVTSTSGKVLAARCNAVALSPQAGPRAWPRRTTKRCIHRDLKPAERPLRHGHAQMVLITDFGLARVGGESQLTATDSFLGTPATSRRSRPARRSIRSGRSPTCTASA